jgi:hypothetical protein
MRKEREQKLVEQWPAWFDTEGDIRQVKEKFGGLGIHLNHANDGYSPAPRSRQGGILPHCEICGQPGEGREGDWIKTLCDEHAGAQGAREHG